MDESLDRDTRAPRVRSGSGGREEEACLQAAVWQWGETQEAAHLSDEAEGLAQRAGVAAAQDAELVVVREGAAVRQRQHQEVLLDLAAGALEEYRLFFTAQHGG